jgi:hypothetical protein
MDRALLVRRTTTLRSRLALHSSDVQHNVEKGDKAMARIALNNMRADIQQLAQAIARMED